MPRHRCAILDDYQNVALKLADWVSLGEDVAVEVFKHQIVGEEVVARTLKGFDIVCLMRERTPFPRTLFEKLPDLRLLVTSGMRNAAIDMAAAKDHKVTVCGTATVGNPTAALTFGLILELTRRVGYEHSRLKAGAPWQATIGTDIDGKTLGLVGLGRLGTRVAAIAIAFGMKVIAWSQNLTADKCRDAGVGYAAKEELFANADVVSIHVQLSDRTRGLIGAAELGLMKPSAYLVNTSRGPIVDEAALLDALAEKRIAGAGLDVFDVEPLALDHPLRTLDNVVLTPHLGYVTEENYRVFYGDMVDNIAGFLAGKPKRVIV